MKKIDVSWTAVGHVDGGLFAYFTTAAMAEILVDEMNRTTEFDGDPPWFAFFMDEQNEKEAQAAVTSGEMDTVSLNGVGIGCIIRGAEENSKLLAVLTGIGPIAISRKEMEPVVIGYWVGGVMGGEFVHWGQDGDTVYPFHDQQEAVKQAEHIQRVQPEDTVYMITLFSNGQMKTEIMPELK